MFLHLYLILSLGAATQEQRVFPIELEKLGGQVELRGLGTMASESDDLESAAGASGAFYRVRSDGLINLAGLDRDGRPWFAELLANGCDLPNIYEGDLDRNGVFDVVLVRHTCGNGLAAATQMMIVTFDERKRPVPFSAVGYLGSNAAGVEALRDVDGDGTAELVLMSTHGDFWTADVYAIRGGGLWGRLESQVDGRNIPVLLARNADRPLESQSELVRLIDLSIDSPAAESLRLLSFEVQNRYDIALTLTSESHPTLSCTHTYSEPFAHIVIDLESGRRIFRLSYPNFEEVQSVLDEIISNRYLVEIYGRLDQEGCKLRMLWASASN